MLHALATDEDSRLAMWEGFVARALAAELGVAAVELHTGCYANAATEAERHEKLVELARAGDVDKKEKPTESLSPKPAGKPKTPPPTKEPTASSAAWPRSRASRASRAARGAPSATSTPSP